MVTRRSLLVGSGAVLGAFGVARGGVAAASVGSRPLAAALPQGAVAGFQLPGGLICPVPYMSRSAWGADESLRYTNNGGYWPEEYYPVQTLTVHHTGFVADPDPTVTVRLIYTRQTLYGDGNAGSLGWGDIGYNLLIDDQGVVYEGRHSGSDSFPVFNPAGAMVTGAHVLHYNTGNIGVCLLGYLNDVPATQAAQDALVTVLAYLAAVGHVNPTGTVAYVNQAPGYQNYTKSVRGVNGHRNWVATDCPGNAFYPLLSSIRTQAAAAMPQPAPSPSPPPSSSEPPSPSPSTSPTGGTPAPSQTSTPSPTPHPTTTQKSGGTRDRGGDEYVAPARKASPSAYPTKHPSPTPTASAVASPSAAPSLPMPTPSWTTPSSVAPATSDTGGPAWGVGATVAGVAAAGVLSAWWWRQRRPVSAPGAAESSTTESSATDGDGAPTDVADVEPPLT
jgi:N-acetylmuramoyl-L-alanine amidase